MLEFYHALEDMLPGTVRSHLFVSELSKPVALADYPHVVIGGTGPDQISGSDVQRPTLGDRPDKVTLTVRITYAALTPASLDVVVRNTRAALDRQAPALDGYRVHRLRLRTLLSIDTDQEISVDGLHPMFTKDEATLTAHKITGGTHADH